MKHLEERAFQHNGNNFSLRLFGTDRSFVVVAFLGEEQVSPSYSVDFVTHADFFMQHKQSLIEDLFALAQSDIEKGMYFHA